MGAAEYQYSVVIFVTEYDSARYSLMSYVTLGTSLILATFGFGMAAPVGTVVVCPCIWNSR